MRKERNMVKTFEKIFITANIALFALVIAFYGICIFTYDNDIVLPYIDDINPHKVQNIAYSPQTMWKNTVDTNNKISIRVDNSAMKNRKENAKLYESVEKAISLIPVELQQIFTQDGFKLEITSNPLNYDLSTKEKASKVYGLTTFADRKIQISLDQNSRDIERTTLHEFGHFVDVCKDGRTRQSETQQFEDIYNKEIYNFKAIVADDNAILDNTKEYYAHAFYTMIYNPKLLKEKCPETYDYMFSGITDAIFTASMYCSN